MNELGVLHRLAGDYPAAAASHRQVDIAQVADGVGLVSLTMLAVGAYADEARLIPLSSGSPQAASRPRAAVSLAAAAAAAVPMRVRDELRGRRRARLRQQPPDLAAGRALERDILVAPVHDRGTSRGTPQRVLRVLDRMRGSRGRLRPGQHRLHEPRCLSGCPHRPGDGVEERLEVGHPGNPAAALHDRQQHDGAPFSFWQDTGVSCWASGCRAVGWQLQDAGGASDIPVASYSETWNGTSWRLDEYGMTCGSDPNCGGDGAGFQAIHCSSASSCTAIGWFDEDSTGPEETAVATWNGSTWQPVASPTLAGRDNELYGLSCVKC